MLFRILFLTRDSEVYLFLKWSLLIVGAELLLMASSFSLIVPELLP
jgi:hypothetical protein